MTASLEDFVAERNTLLEQVPPQLQASLREGEAELQARFPRKENVTTWDQFSEAEQLFYERLQRSREEYLRSELSAGDVARGIYTWFAEPVRSPRDFLYAAVVATATPIIGVVDRGFAGESLLPTAITALGLGGAAIAAGMEWGPLAGIGTWFIPSAVLRTATLKTIIQEQTQKRVRETTTHITDFYTSVFRQYTTLELGMESKHIMIPFTDAGELSAPQFYR